MKLTSANANKLIKKLNEKKAFLIGKENSGMVYVCADGETPVIPEYDYESISAQIAAIDEKIVRIKHAVNKVNMSESIDVNGVSLTIDTVLVKMAQATQRKDKLDTMRKLEKKSRLNSHGFGSASTLIEYKYANFDIDKVSGDYEALDAEITSMQLALDRFNQTFEFDVDIEL